MPKTMVGAYIDEALATDLRNAAYWDRESISDIVAEAVQKLLRQRERARGSPYPERPPPRSPRGRPAKRPT